MTRSELIHALSARFPSLTQTDVSEAIALILGAITDTLADGNRVEIRGFGSFVAKDRPPRISRNPQNGAKVDVPAKRVVTFKAGLELRERVDRSVRF